MRPNEAALTIDQVLTIDFIVVYPAESTLTYLIVCFVTTDFGNWYLLASERILVMPTLKVQPCLKYF